MVCPTRQHTKQDVRYLTSVAIIKHSLLTVQRIDNLTMQVFHHKHTNG